MARIKGNNRSNTLNGTSSNDTIYGLGGNDSLFGYGGDDILEGGTGADHLDGGDGIDRAEYRKSKAGVTVNLGLNFGLGGEAQGDTFTSIENVYGSRYADLLVGDGAKNVLVGRNGDDTLKGEGGADHLLGGNGKDTLEGGEGDDNLSGGDSSDIYVYAKGGGADTIEDGGHKDKDVIKISDYEADQTFVVRLDESDDLLISFGGENGADSIIVKNTLGGSTADTVEQIKFEDGTVWKIADVITRVDNEAPIAVDDLGSTVLPDQKVVIPVANMLSNDSDPDGDELSLVSVYDAKGGSVEITEDGEVVFTPEAGFSGTASFLYTVTDGTAASEAMCAFEVEVEFSRFIGNWWAETIDLSDSTLPCYIDCGLGNDIATGSDLRDQILGAGGDDTMNGGGGNDDFLIGLGHGFDRFDGGDGYDVVLATEDGVSIGLIGDFNASVEEFSCAGFANVGIMGTWQAQTLDFTGVTLTDIRWIDAGRGNDTVLGSDGDDVIIGGLGDDTLSGAGGDDDFLVGPGDGFDTIDGGSGFDQILATADGTNIGFLGSFANGVEEISANGFADVQIKANWQSQTYDFSNVTLTGITAIDMGSGNDTAIGSAGDDVIIGGLGNDALTGGLGADTFVFADGDGQDVITDFKLVEDVVRLDEIAGFEDFADVQGALSQVGADTLLDFGDGQTILFEDTLVGAFSTDNFDFLLGDL
ncbi:MAG: cadherin-like domain-containing protein [Rhizobiales bacterium]|nr:cadherin-like domain-containing protein [Hyphomicrobiales bacterium]